MAYIHAVNLRSIDLNLIVILDALLSERSVTRAARRLYLSQPATSNALRRLRQLLKDPLLVRGPSGMELTPRAVALARPVAQALRDVDAALSDHARFDPKTAEFTVHLCATEYVGFVLLPPLLAHVQEAAPRVKLIVREIDPRSPLGPLHSGRADIVCAYVPDPPHELHYRELFRDNWVCLARKSHPHVADRLTLKQFGALAHIVLPMQTGGYASFVANMLTERGMTRNVAASLPHFLAVPHIVSRSDLIMTTTERIGSAFAAQYPIKVIRHPLPTPGFGVAMFWHHRTDADASHRWFREAMASVAAKLPPMAAKPPRRRSAGRKVV